MMMPEELKHFKTNQNITRRASMVVIVLMMACFGVTLMQFCQRLDPTWQGSYLPLAAGLFSAEALYAHWFNFEKPFRDQLIYRFSELVTLLVLIKLELYLRDGFAQFLSDLSGWQVNISNFFLGGTFGAGRWEYALVIILMVVVWSATTLFAVDLRELQVDEEEIYMENPSLMQRSRQEIRARLVQRFMGLGIVMILMAFLIRLNLSGVNIHTPASRAPVVNLVVYFMLAMVLLSLTQFSILGGRWMWLQVPVSRGLMRGWLVYSAIFLALISAVALILPTSYTTGFLRTLAVVFGILFQIVTLIFALVWIPILWLLRFLSNLFGLHPASDSLTPPPQPPPVLPDGPQGLSWLDLLRSIVFWLAIVAIIGFGVRYYWNQNKTLWARLLQMPRLAWLGRAWQWLAGFLLHAQRRAAVAIAAGRRYFRRSTSSILPDERLSNLSRLTPRQRVLYFFIHLTQRGERVGRPRRGDQTPSAYGQALGEAYPEVQKEIDEMAQAFNEARYSRHPITPLQAHGIQNFWKRVLEVLRPHSD